MHRTREDLGSILRSPLEGKGRCPQASRGPACLCGSQDPAPGAQAAEAPAEGGPCGRASGGQGEGGGGGSPFLLNCPVMSLAACLGISLLPLFFGVCAALHFLLCPGFPRTPVWGAVSGGETPRAEIASAGRGPGVPAASTSAGSPLPSRAKPLRANREG